MSETKSPLARLLRLEGDVRIEFIESQALKGNPLGDPAERPVAAYLPPGYDPQGSRRYPVLYCLHGYTGDAAALLSARPWETNVVQWMDRLISAKKMPPAILAIVDGFTRLGGSQYVDSIHNGGYATYTVRDVVGHVDATYRTIASEGGRAVFGKSSGGFGALYLSMQYPGTFAAFASHSGDSYFEYAHPRAFPDVHRTLEKHDWNIGAFVAHFEGLNKRQPAEYSTMEMLGYASAYSPRGAKAFDLDLPLERGTGELNQAIFDRWLQFDPARMCLQKKAELARLRLRYIDCGRKDEYGLDIGARVMASRMRELGLEVRHEEFDDDHRNVGYRYAISMPALAGVLESQ
ncbi:MAG TPA: alpha/beta hydrolase-fold protein [Candidatus Rubrimentiphilum sp.]|nr:alpha/beta hydrolase-fold protein [Candidatus Rubrimentiphilum sp.]